MMHDLYVIYMTLNYWIYIGIIGIMNFSHGNESKEC